jgi:hypothetical protein
MIVIAFASDPAVMALGSMSSAGWGGIHGAVLAATPVSFAEAEDKCLFRFFASTERLSHAHIPVRETPGIGEDLGRLG